MINDFSGKCKHQNARKFLFIFHKKGVGCDFEIDKNGGIWHTEYRI